MSGGGVSTHNWLLRVVNAQLNVTPLANNPKKVFGKAHTHSMVLIRCDKWWQCLNQICNDLLYPCARTVAAIRGRQTQSSVTLMKYRLPTYVLYFPLTTLVSERNNTGGRERERKISPCASIWFPLPAASAAKVLRQTVCFFFWVVFGIWNEQHS